MKLVSILAVALFAASIPAYAAPQMTAKQILNTTTTATGQPIAMPSGRLRVIGSIVVIPPAYAGGYHKHIYPRYAYVLAGTLNVQDKGGATRHYVTGSAFVETIGSWHRARVQGRTPVRLFVLDQMPQGMRTNTVQAP